MDNNISLSENIKIQVRIQVLYDVIKELCCAFDFPKTIQDVLHKGIVEKQLLGSILANYIDDSGNSVGLVRFNIDWDKHKMYADSTMGKHIEIQTDKPLIEQFALWSTDIIKYVQIMQKELNVKTIDVYFRYRDEVLYDPTANKEASEFLGLGGSVDEITFNDEKINEFERKMKFVSEMLPELEIEIISNRKKD